MCVIHPYPFSTSIFFGRPPFKHGHQQFAFRRQGARTRATVQIEVEYQEQQFEGTAEHTRHLLIQQQHLPTPGSVHCTDCCPCVVLLVHRHKTHIRRLSAGQVRSHGFLFCCPLLSTSMKFKWSVWTRTGPLMPSECIFVAQPVQCPPSQLSVHMLPSCCFLKLTCDFILTKCGSCPCTVNMPVSEVVEKEE